MYLEIQTLFFFNSINGLTIKVMIVVTVASMDGMDDMVGKRLVSDDVSDLEGRSVTGVTMVYSFVV